MSGVKFDMKSLYLYWDDSEALEEIRNLLQQGEVIAGTSDTVLGLLADITEQGFCALNRIKQRTDKPYIVLTSSKEKCAFFTDHISQNLEKMLAVCWPGPLTIIVRAKETVPDYLKTKEGTIALRVPRHQGLLRLLAYFDGLFSTSANKTGKPIPINSDELDPEIQKKVARIIIDRVKHKQYVQPSTILKCLGSKITVIREGAYTREALERICGRSFEC